MSVKGQLFVCASPIGNLADCTFRLIETLKNVHLIATEDTRTTKILLNKYSISQKCICLEKHNETERIQEITQQLDHGHNVALVSEAGTPNIADPGAYFITQIRALGYEIVPIPGASAVTCLLSVSGMLANQFTFQGFFPKKESEAQQCLTQLRPLNIPILYYEAANRLLKTMQLIAAFDANAQVFVGKELTKMFETFWSGNIQDVLVQLAQANLKGEWCFVLKLSEVEQAQNLSEIVSNLKKIGLTNKQIIAVGTKFLNLSKNELYKEAIS